MRCGQKFPSKESVPKTQHLSHFLLRQKKQNKNSTTLLRKESLTTWHMVQLFNFFTVAMIERTSTDMASSQTIIDPPYHKIRRERSQTSERGRGLLGG